MPPTPTRLHASAAGPLTRREFLGAAALGASGLLLACSDGTAPDDREPTARLHTRPFAPTGTVPAGFSLLGMKNILTERDGVLFVPASYNAAVASPLLVLFHGAGQSASMWATPACEQLFNDFGLVVLAPDSRGYSSWDILEEGVYGPDVRFLDDALERVFTKCRIDPARIVMAGFSDGASAALGLGLMNGDLFSATIGFSPGSLYAPFVRGSPRAFVAHGNSDSVLPFAYTRDTIVPQIRALGVDATFHEFSGDHAVPSTVASSAFDFAF